MKKIIINLLIWFFVFFWFSTLSNANINWNYGYLSIENDNTVIINHSWFIGTKTFNSSIENVFWVVDNSWNYRGLIQIETWFYVFFAKSNWYINFVFYSNNYSSWINVTNLSSNYGFAYIQSSPTHYSIFGRDNNDGWYWGGSATAQYLESYDFTRSLSWEVFIDWILYWNNTCSEIFTSDEVKFDFTNKNEYTVFTDYLNINRESAFISYWTESAIFQLSIENVEDLYWFSGSIINENDSSFLFNSLESPFKSWPKLQFEVIKWSYVNYFKLDSISWSSWQKVYWLIGDKVVDFLPLLDWEDFSNFNLNKLYYFKNIKDFTWFIFIFEKQYSNIDLKVDFWKIVKEDNIHYVCVNSSNEIETVDGESYSWTFDNIWQLDNSNNNLSLETNNSYISSSISVCSDIQITGFVSFFQYLGCYIEKITTWIWDIVSWIWRLIDELMRIGQNVEHKDILSFFISSCNASDNVAVNSIFTGMNWENPEYKDNNKFLFNIYHFIKWFLYFIVFILLIFLLWKARWK